MPLFTALPSALAHPTDKQATQDDRM